MQSRPPLALLALSAMALAMDGLDQRPLTDEEKKARDERERLADEAEAKRRATREAENKAAWDAAAAPHREARRLRNLKKMQQHDSSRKS